MPKSQEEQHLGAHLKIVTHGQERQICQTCVEVINCQLLYQ